MKSKSTLITFSLLLLTSAATAAEYTVTGTRYLRKYTAPQKSQAYMAETDAQRVANNMCEVAWEKSDAEEATATTHVTTNLDWNVKNRERFDAALFCANHVGGEHVAYANAACYVFEFPTGAALPALTNLTLTAYTDPYNAYGARITVMASDTPEIPTACATVRGDVAGGIKATGAVARVTRTSGGKDYWYPNTGKVVFSSGGSGGLGVSGLQLKRYLFVFVLMENYATSRGNWLEGSTYIENAVKIKTSGEIAGWSAGCDIAEPWATQYHLKDGHADEDWDGDGLSNYAEYLITKVFRFATLDPDNPKTDGSCVDYFRKEGDLYFGEMFAGMRGQVEGGRHEVEQRTYSSIRLRTTYFGKRRIKAKVVAQAWSQARDAEMTGAPDETFETAAYVVNGERTAAAARDAEKSMGLDMRGKFKLAVFADEDGDGKYTPGEPFGFVRDAELGASEIAVALTDESAVFARLDLLTGKYAAMPGVVSVATSNETAGVAEAGRHTRVRVVRARVDGKTTLGVDKDGFPVSVFGVVLDKYMDLGTRSCLHEGDFLTDGAFDIGWAQTQGQVYGRYVLENKMSKFIDATNITYYVVVGEGVAATNSPARFVVNRVYDSVRLRYKTGANPVASTIRPVIDKTQPRGYVYGSRPTFRWAMQNGNGVNYDSYTAFKLQITSAGTTNAIYDSGYRPLPTRDSAGWYSWALDEPIGSVIPASGNYSWRVSMYNAKYRDYGFWYDRKGFCSYVDFGDQNHYHSVAEWSDLGVFTVDMNNVQAMNDHGYSSISASVKYAGPSAVIASVASSGTTGKCIVQAFETVDFAGSPAGSCYAKAGLADTASVATNAVVRGLPQSGTYWLRAFIDQNGNGVKDAWEPCGTSDAAVVLTKGTIATPKVEIWLADADTDGDWVPDSYEMATYGSLTNMAASIIGGDLIKFNGSASATGSASISRGLGGASLTTFQNAPLVNALLQGLDNTVSVEAIRVAAEE